jgi:hypothetical protein
MTARWRLLENQTKTNRASPKGAGSLPGGLAFDTAVTLVPPKGPLMRCTTSPSELGHYRRIPVSVMPVAARRCGRVRAMR